MYVMKGEREVKLTISESGVSTINDGRSQYQIETAEAVQLLESKLGILRSKMLQDLKGCNDSAWLEHKFRQHVERITDINRLFDLLAHPSQPQVERKVMVQFAQEAVKPVSKPAALQQTKTAEVGVIVQRKKTTREGITPVRVPEMNIIAAQQRPA